MDQDSEDLDDKKMIKSHQEVFIFVGLLILNAAHQQDKENSAAEDDNDMDLGTPPGTMPGINPQQFLQHKITMPTPQHMDSQLRLVEHKFDFSYVKDPVHSSLLTWTWLILFFV